MTATTGTPTFVFLIVMSLLGCGRRDADTASADSAAAGDTALTAEVSDTAVSASTAGNSAEPAGSSQAVTVQDIDRWQKGMAGEIKALEAVSAKMKQAKTPTDKLSIMEEAHEQSTASAGAQAAGVDEARYDFIRSKLSGAVAHLAPPEIPGLDTASIPQSQRDQMRAERDDYFKKMAWAVPPDVVKALEPRAKELRKEDMELTVARAKASGMQ